MKKSVVFIFLFTFFIMLISIAYGREYREVSLNIFGNLKTSFANFTANTKSVQYENEQLKKQLSQQSYQASKNQILQEENNRLRQALGLRNNNNYKVITHGEIISLCQNGDYYLIIDKGSDHGVKKDHIAIWGNALVGRVYDVYNKYSYILPITAPNTTTGIMSENSDTGIITGNLGLFRKNMCEISFFYEDASTTPNTHIVTSGLSDIYPEGLTVGKIALTGSTKVLKTEVDLGKIRTVTIITR